MVLALVPMPRRSCSFRASGEAAARDSGLAPALGFVGPVAVRGCDRRLLAPRAPWAAAAAYDAKARELAGLFRENFERFADASDAVRHAGPPL